VSTTEIKTSCNRDCPDGCGVIAHVEDGRVVKLSGDPDHPVTRGFLCYRTNRFLERQYSPDRLTAPLIREGDRFRTAGWEEVLDRIASTMLKIREESGPGAILHYRSGGSLGLMKHVTDYFFERFGPVAIKDGDICNGAGDAAQEADFGIADSSDQTDMMNSRTIVMWGKDPHTSNVHLIPFLQEAKSGGARILNINPIPTRVAEMAELSLCPRPGGDLALALGAALWFFDNERIDRSAETYCDHLESYEKLVRSRTLEEYATIADLQVGDLIQFAERFAEGPTCIQVGWGMQRRRNGATIIRAIDALATISGNIGIPGGGVSYYFQRRGAFDTSFQSASCGAPRKIPEHSLGRSILDADPKVRMVWVDLGNPVAMLPDSRATIEALKSRDLTVVVDAFLTDTAQCADIVLPTTTMLEDDDLIGAYGNSFIGQVRPVTTPPGEPGMVKTDYEIVQALAPRVGVGAPFDRPARAWKEQLLSNVAGKGVTLELLEKGGVRNPDAPQVLFADRVFPTFSGRVQLLCDADLSLPELPPSFPLQMMALSTRKAQCAQWEAKDQQGLLVATVHPDAVPGFEEGDQAVLESEIGSILVQLKFNTALRSELVLMDKGGWMSAGRCANAITPAWITDMGGGAAYYETPVRTRKKAAAEGN